MIVNRYNTPETRCDDILSTFPLVGEDVKSAVVVEFRKMGKAG